MVCGAVLDESTVFEYSGEEITRRGIFDLVMIGDNVISIEKWAKLLAKDTTVELVFSTIDIVEDTDGVKYHVLESGGPLPKEGGYLPDDVLIGVRPEALLEFDNKIQGVSDASEKSPTSDRAYISDQLAILNQAAQRYWANADPKDRSTHPDKKEVVLWLQKHGYSPTLAVSGATILRPAWAGVGRPPEK